MNAKQIFVIAIIAMFLIVPFASAKQESVDVGTVKQDKKIEENAVDKTKEQPKEVKNKDKDITGKITVTDSNTSAYTVTKEGDAAIKIKRIGEHTKVKVTIPKEELQKIDEDGDKLYGVLHIADDGTTTHGVVTESQLTSGIEMIFSENIVNGFSGYDERTYTGVTSGTILDIPDVSGGDHYVTASVGGTIPTYTAGIPTSGLALKYTMENISGSTIIDNSGNGRNGTITNATVVTGIKGDHRLYFNGMSKVTFTYPNSSAYTFCAQLHPTDTATTKHYAVLTRDGIYGRFLLASAVDEKNRIGVYNGSAYTYVTGPTSRLTPHYTASSINDTSVSMWYNGLLSKTSSIPTKMTTYNSAGIIGSVRTNAYESTYVGYLDDVLLYTRVLSTSEISQVYAGGSGISVRPSPSYNFTPYNVASGVEKIIDTDATCTGLEYIDTTGGTHTVTVRVYFTEDITKSTETKGAVYQNVSIIHTKQNATASVGSIVYELDPLYSGDPVLTSNNTNATASRNDTHMIISTGLVKQGQSFSYAVSVPDNHDHGIHLGNLMKWVGTGWDFVSTAPEDWTNYIGDQIKVTVS